MAIWYKKSQPIVDEVIETFARHGIYSIENLYYGYDQFQLVVENRNLISLALFCICTLP